MKKNLLLSGLMVLGLSAIAQTPRLSLVEEFTGETCPPCAAYNPAFNALLATPNSVAKVVAIKWQVPIPSAPANTWSLYQTNKPEINWRYSTYGYGINSAPSVRIDGQMPTVFGAAGQNITQMNANVFNTAQSYTSAFSITMTRAWDATGSAVDVTVNIVATAPFTSVGNLVFRNVMVERLIQFSVQPGTNGEKDFENVAIKSFPDIQNGTLLPSTWTLGQTHTFTMTCAIPSYCRKKGEIAFVGFIQDEGNRKVAQAVRADKQALPNDALALNAEIGVVCTPTLAPLANIKNEGLNPITSMSIVSYVNSVASGTTTWTGNLAPGASTALTLNSITTPTTNVANNYSFNITAINAVDFNTTNNTAKISFAAANNFQGTPVAEGFVLGAFPPVGFTNVNPNGGPGWARINGSGLGAYGISNECAKQNFFTNPVIGDKDEFILPPINLLGTNVPNLDFDIAYVQRDGNSNDKLEIFVSDNCGANWVSVFSQAGPLMTSLPPQANAYTPQAGEWRTESVPLTGFNKPNVLVKFVTTNDNGNNLFIDNINLSQTAPTGITQQNNNGTFSAVIYPNPYSNVLKPFTVKINSPAANNATIKVVNSVGQLVYEKQASLNSGSNEFELNTKDYANGIYSVVIESANGNIVKTLSINK